MSSRQGTLPYHHRTKITKILTTLTIALASILFTSQIPHPTNATDFNANYEQVFSDDFNRANTANVKTDFGAVGDGITDDTNAIRAAFNSSYDTIIVPAGNYRLAQQVKFTAGDKTIIGEKATLFADNNYTRPTDQYANHWLVVIRDVNNITFKGLRFHASYGSSTHAPFGALAGLIAATNIHFDNCDFSSDPRLTNASLSALDFFANWHTVSITNSTINMLNDNTANDGGGVMFRAFWGFPVSDAVFSNNTSYKQGPDELLWLATDETGSSMTNVEISGNRLYRGEGSGGGAFAFATYAVSPDQIKNVNFHDNEIIDYSNNSPVMLEGVENFDLYNNDISTKISGTGGIIDINGVPTTLYPGAIIKSRDMDSNSPITTDTVKIHDNRTLSITSNIKVAGFTDGSQPYHVYNNPHVVIQAPTANDVIHHYGNFINNNVIVNGNVASGIITTYPYRNDQSQPKIVQDNTILVNGTTSQFLRNFDANLAAPATYTGNHITTTQKTSSTRLIMIHNLAMNNFPITISNNTFINASSIQNDESLALYTRPNTGSNTITDRSTDGYGLLWYISGLEDAAPADQTATICNNTIKGFRSPITPWLSATIDLTC